MHTKKNTENPQGKSDKEIKMAKLLIVDDEKGIRDVIREYSEFNGHEVTEAEDGMTEIGRAHV